MNSAGGGLRVGGGVARFVGAGDDSGSRPTCGGSSGPRKEEDEEQRGEYRWEETLEVKVTDVCRNESEGGALTGSLLVMWVKVGGVLGWFRCSAMSGDVGDFWGVSGDWLWVGLWVGRAGWLVRDTVMGETEVL